MSAVLKEKIKKYVMNLGVDDVGVGAVSDYKSSLSTPFIIKEGCFSFFVDN